MGLVCVLPKERVEAPVVRKEVSVAVPKVPLSNLHVFTLGFPPLCLLTVSIATATYHVCGVATPLQKLWQGCEGSVQTHSLESA